MRLEGKVALVSGGSRGIGRATAELFAEEGAVVVVGDKDEPTEPYASETVEWLNLDVTDLARWQQVVAEVEQRHGRLDVLFNNAGLVGSYAPVDEVAVEDWHAIVAVNQTGTFYGMRCAVPAMRRAGGGSIVNVSSIWGNVGAAGVAPYQASKGAVRTMTKNAAMSYVRDGIRVNSIHPGLIDTPMVRAQDQEVTDAVVALTPMARAAHPREVAYGVLFLASDESSFVTGSELVIDGGYTAQ